MPLASFKLATAWKFFLDANLSWVNEESCSTARLTWPLMDRRCTNQLLGLDCDFISTTVAMLTGYCVMGRHGESMQLSFSDFCCGCRSAEEEETVIHFFCQCPSLAGCRNRLFGSPFLVSLTELSSIDIKDIASLIKLSGWFSSGGSPAFNGQSLSWLTSLSFMVWVELGQYRDCLHLWRYNGLLCVLKWTLWYDQSYHSDLT